MAEHLRHRLAREGLVVRPDAIVTLSRFVEPLVSDLPAAGPVSIDRAVAAELAAEPPEAFARVAEMDGLRRMLARLVEEVAPAQPQDAVWPESGLSAAAHGFAKVFRAVERRLAASGLHLRATRLRTAAGRLRTEGHPWQRLFLAGFYAFTPAELEVLAALAPAQVEVSLPPSAPAEASREWLRRAGWEECPLPAEPRNARRRIVAAASEQQEAEEIARRILEAHAAGRPFREIGVVVRSEYPYVPLLRTTLARFGVPARFYFPRTLAAHPLGVFLLRLLDTMRRGAGHEHLLGLLASPLGGLWPGDSGDRIRYALCESLPGSGIPEEIERASPLFSAATWQRLRTAALPPAAWAKEGAALLAAIPLPTPDPKRLLELRPLLSARAGWGTAFELLCENLPDEPVMLDTVHDALERILEHVPVDDGDRRRHAVQVIDVYEARQWRLPLVFVCGLTERVFPQYHAPHPILNDRDRELLRGCGIALRTSAERQREESLLFETALGCAIEETVLSYPKSSVHGEELLPSLFLPPLDTAAESCVPARPPALWPKPASGRVRIAEASLRAQLRKLRATLSPTAVEAYLQCPFQYFGRSVLKPRQMPALPAERLDLLLQGNILHETIAAGEGSPLLVDQWFHDAFAEACREHSIPPGWRTEAVLLDLERNLLRFLESPPLAGARTLAVESDFRLKLRDDVRIRGRMDRLARVDGRGVVVVDYKYSNPDRVRSRIRAHQSGELVQGGLYLWAVRKMTGQPPAAMLYCGLRTEVSWAGWHVPMFGWEEIGETCDAAELDAIAGRAVETSLDVADRIGEGIIAPHPADEKKCTWCEFRDACRVESAPAAEVAGA